MAAPLDLLRFYFGRLGRPGMLGVVLLLGGLAYLAAVVLPKASSLEALAASNQQARIAAAKQARTAREEVGGGQAQALAPEAAAALRRLYAAADEAELELVQGEYRMVASAAAGVRQYQFVLPVYGSYADVRTFLALALNNDPALALASMQMRREAIEDTELDVALNFTLYLGAEP